MVPPEPRMISLGFGKYARADRIFALEPLRGEERGGGRRTRGWGARGRGRPVACPAGAAAGAAGGAAAREGGGRGGRGGSPYAGMGGGHQRTVHRLAHRANDPAR